MTTEEILEIKHAATRRIVDSHGAPKDQDILIAQLCVELIIDRAQLTQITRIWEGK